MSTMLATTNPEAVAEIETRDRRVPYVGQTVLFHARPGEGRQGKLVSPALVIGVDDEDHVELLIIYAADDFIVRWKIARKSEQNPINSWTFNAHDEEHYQPGSAKLPVETETGHMTWEDVKIMYKQIGELLRLNTRLTERVTALEGVLSGPMIVGDDLGVRLPKTHKKKPE